MPTINPQRLLNDLRQLRTFGAHGNGVVRLALSPIDMESRRWLVGRLTEAGLEARIDGIGTVFGRSRHALDHRDGTYARQLRPTGVSGEDRLDTVPLLAGSQGRESL